MDVPVQQISTEGETVPPSCSPVFLCIKNLNIPMFQYFACIFSTDTLQRAPYMMYVLNLPSFQYIF